MWQYTQTALEIGGLILMVLVNFAGIFLVAAQLPGTWVILGTTGLVAWWRWDDGLIGVYALVTLGVLAILGELIELFAGSAGSAKAGGTRTGAALALVGGVVGAILGSFVPILIVGTVLGACIGAGVGAMTGDRMRGRSWEDSKLTAKGAFVGKFWGTIAKMAVAAIMWIVSVLVLFF